MRILENHADFIEYEPLSKAVKDAEECERVKKKYENVLVVFTSIEENDDESIVREAVVKIIEDMKRVKADRILIYPYAHLTPNLAKPEKAKELLKKMELFAKEQGVETHRAPFGWYKTFTLSCKGHPLAELSRSFERGREVEVKKEKRIVDEMKKFYSEIARKLGEERTKELDTASHILAFAIKKVFPHAKLGLGSPELDGFYYDFELGEVSMEDVNNIEVEMRKIIESEYELKTEVISKKKAKEIFKNEKYKLEFIDEIPGDTVKVCKIKDFVDICENPHVKLKKIKAIKLLKLGGAYWKGDPTKPMLKRIYGIAFPSEEELNNFLKLREEAEKRDHRKIGKQLDLFSFHEEAPGFVFFHPNGIIIWNVLLDFWRKEHRKAGYLEVKTPIILKRNLWERSGHWEHYRESMYFTKVDDEDFAIKPMNCPGGILIYKSKPRSYRDLPLKLAEIGLVHRHELSGVLCGLFRVRAFTQDDAHIFCTPDQLKEEIKKVIEMCVSLYKTFGFEFRVELSTRPEKSIGTDEMWERAETALREALEDIGMRYKLNPGEGAFYGPKIDFHLTDCLGRSWQCGTIQVDFAMPERFELTYVGKDGKEHRPVMIHRVIFGSIERFLGILVEHYGGAFPTWLSPTQVIVIPLSEKYVDYGRKVLNEFLKNDIRAEIDESAATVEYKIRDAQLRKIPYMIVVGEREAKSNKIAVRRRDGEVRYDVEITGFISKLLEEISERKSALTF
jgi:threonyl-tRNA synthetase